MTENNAGIAYRLLDESDHAFVYSSFLNSYRDSPMVRGVPNTIYFKKQHDLIERILVSPRCRAIVACSATDPTTIYGYILGETNEIRRDTLELVVHWVYCKQPFRNCGIARELYNKFAALTGNTSTSGVYFTHRVKTVDRLLQSLPHLIFNPYLLGA